MIARCALDGVIDGDVNLKNGILVMTIILGGFIGSNFSGYLIDHCAKFKVIGIASISAGIKKLEALETKISISNQHEKLVIF